MCLRYSSRVVAPTARSSPRASIGFSMFAASTAPSAAPAPTIVCSSSMKRINWPSAFLISPSTAFSRSSNSPRYFAPASRAPMSSAQTRFPFRPYVTADDRVELALLRRGGEVAAELLERLVGALGILRGDALAAAHRLDLRLELVARDDIESEQQVLGRDEVVLHLLRLVEGLVEH